MQLWQGIRAKCIFCSFAASADKSFRRSAFHSGQWLQRGTIRKKRRIKELPDNLDDYSAKINAHIPPIGRIKEKRLEIVADKGEWHRKLRGWFRRARDELKNNGSDMRRWEAFQKEMEKELTEESESEATKTARRKKLESSYTENMSGSYVTVSVIKLFYMDYAYSSDLPPNAIENQRKLCDFRYPTEWYPRARAIQRTIHLHVGPTNSGKTYNALKKLEEAKTGFYSGPLRLLAHEVYARMKAKGRDCSLITGDEVRIDPGTDAGGLFSHTVEMVPTNRVFDVGVIDEIQMISDPERGWAWTRAFLGTQCKELHLCGETRVIPLIREMVASCGDVLEIHRYKRLNSLEAESKSFKGNLRMLQKGDCVVSFSVLSLFALKGDIEKATGKRCAIVYGSLPPEIRTQQAALFNDPDNDYDYLVASDAIGMGLNLSIKRVIFESTLKSDGQSIVRLTIPQLKQIAGRAGRYRVAPTAGSTAKDADTKQEDASIGLVTSLQDDDLPYVQDALGIEPEPIRAAGLLPPDNVIQRIAAYFPPDVKYTYILARIYALSSLHPRYFLCSWRDAKKISGLLEDVPELNVADRTVFSAAPTPRSTIPSDKFVRALGAIAAKHGDGAILGIPQLPLELLEEPVSPSKQYIRDLEQLHKSLVLYIWLSYRFGGVFIERDLATYIKGLVEGKIQSSLTEFSANEKLKRQLKMSTKAIRQTVLERLQKEFNDNLYATQQVDEMTEEELEAAAVAALEAEGEGLSGSRGSDEGEEEFDEEAANYEEEYEDEEEEGEEDFEVEEEQEEGSKEDEVDLVDNEGGAAKEDFDTGVPFFGPAGGLMASEPEVFNPHLKQQPQEFLDASAPESSTSEFASGNEAISPAEEHLVSKVEHILESIPGEDKSEHAPRESKS